MNSKIIFLGVSVGIFSLCFSGIMAANSYSTNPAIIKSDDARCSSPGSTLKHIEPRTAGKATPPGNPIAPPH